MDEINKGAGQRRIEADIKLLKFLIESEGLSRVIRLTQYAIEAIADEISKPQNGDETEKADRYLQAAESIEPIYIKIKDEIKL